MKTKLPCRFASLAILVLASSPFASAHPGHGPTDLVTGFLHPLTGWDHLLAMVAVGLWAAQLGGRARWALPATFVGAMALGAVAGIAGFAPAGVDSAILASVFALGLLVAGAVRMPLGAGLALVGLAGACHGAAHGAEMPWQADSLQFLGGMVAATALLHASGVIAGVQGLKHSRNALRWAGAAIVAGGFALLLA
jgi:urease accessory protein